MTTKNLPAVKLMSIKRLKGHEQTNPIRLQKILRRLMTDGYFTRPILVDKKTYTILDGHHRYQLLKKLGCSKIPGWPLDYRSRRITVTSRRPEYKINKKIIVARAGGRQLFPYKTSKHTLAYPLPKIKVDLNELY